MTMVLAAWLALMLQAGAGVETIARDGMSQVETPRQAVARTAAEWSALWRDHAGDTPAPAVDLAARTVVAVFLGTRASAGYAVEIVGTRRDGQAVIVEWRERRPAPDAIPAQVLTAPAHLATIPRAVGEIRFEKVQP